MNRRGFLKRIGIVSAAVAVAPSILITAEATSQVVADKSIILGDGIFEQMKKSNVHYYNTLTQKDIEDALNNMIKPPQEREFKIYGDRRQFDAILKKQNNEWWT